MDWKEFFKPTVGKILAILLISFAAFFINILALQQPCNWREICPDYIRTGIITAHPNFYNPAGCGYGIGYICWKSSWSISTLIFDLIIWIALNFFVLLFINKFKKK
ncbi:MAG TPA: hypothetical protein VI564_07845 [Candidatus Nanoarchaeia archaeon]|nr:hypothetical protein [Candidatus Nanoarchaeia archaeon]